VSTVAQDLSDIYRVIDGVSWLVIDFETTGLDYHRDDMLGFSLQSEKGVLYVPLKPYRTESDAVLRPCPDPVRVGQLLAPSVRSLPVLGWNLKFDMHFLKRLTGAVVEKPIDVQVGYWLLNEDGELGLKDVCTVLSGKDLETFSNIKNRATTLVHQEIVAQREGFITAEGARQGLLPRGVRWKMVDIRKEANKQFPMRPATAADYPIEWVAPYCAKDALFTSALWFGLVRPQLMEESLLDYFYSYEMPFLRVLFNMEERGIMLDERRLVELEKDLNATLFDIETQIYNVAGCEFNIGSTDQLADVLFNKMKFPPSGRKTKTGNDSLDEEALKILHSNYGTSQPIFPLLIDYRETKKIASTYTSNLIKEAWEGRIYTKFRQTGTVTGRLSSSEPNLQNIPKDEKIRSAFIARPGYKLIKADFSQAELRVLADRSQDPTLIEVYEKGEDIHLKTQTSLGIADRRVAKVINFGITYDIGPKSLHERLLFDAGIDIPVAECATLKRGWYQTYDGVVPWKERVWTEGRSRGYIVSRFGRRRRLPFNSLNDVERSYAERMAVNYLIQGDVADLMRACMITIDLALPDLGSELLLQVHDELVIEVPQEYAATVGLLVKEQMEGVLPYFSVPIVADVGIGDSWGKTVDLDKYGIGERVAA
jgi:DNA polymerase I-like protein with 3'-5' exonuclease and polymerase domains